ncbi:hypothetical protein BO83DRAFT_236487 [Aspergillus eucalypticola CBS 122712]|uniref:Secreted protein n=1 Tax=Aspergillus eucalypticola (strain CBS 122712 / IBT 29274) TaxID=1448314 RepID=A0A317VTP0_ASPEC|nr:uncharacterized protein BO83DRAFT_236487 [Aspergillus eucalypticola CBS 122712]PWY76681.1 hypothetical protein BO83DRAFT_236487 [Aspergillus eucalypticola CBS 122712]
MQLCGIDSLFCLHALLLTFRCNGHAPSAQDLISSVARRSLASTTIDPGNFVRTVGRFRDLNPLSFAVHMSINTS